MATGKNFPSQTDTPFSDLEKLRPWVEAETGMDFSGNRMARLKEAVNKIGSPNRFPDGLDRLMEIPVERGVFLERLTAALTVGESFFFRNSSHMRALREEVLPAILRENSDRREIRIWSAGCAGGEEPYSVAILLDQLLGGQPLWRISILGTDLNPEFLARARTACYRPWSFRQTKIHEDRNYFSPDGELFELTPRIRETVRFNYLNLVKDIYPSPLTGTLGLDLILFRNVAIYLKPEITKQILERFYRALRPGGWLLLGETEVSLAVVPGFLVRRFDQATFYQKPPEAPSANEEKPVTCPIIAEPVLPPFPALAARPIPGGAVVPDWGPLPKRSDRGLSRPSGLTDDDDVVSSPFPEVKRLLRDHQWDKADRAIESIRNKTVRADFRLQLTKSLLMHAAIDRARDMLSSCLADDPLLIEAQLLKASFAEESGDLTQAEEAYRRALYIDRNCPMAHFHLGLVLQQKGDPQGSQRSFRTALKLVENQNPQDLVAYGEGVCYGRLKEMVQMIFEL